jgi:diguanylate cyclase (GGDEF) domain
MLHLRDNKTLLVDVLDRERLTALFQPMVNLGDGTLYGYEGLIRGPSDSPLHTPFSLLRVATEFGLRVPLETLCQRVISRTFVSLGLPGFLFLNISPDVLVQRFLADGSHDDAEKSMSARVVLELTEGERFLDYKPEHLKAAVESCLKEGNGVAIDDLGEGFSSLRLWSELRPTYVKIDRHFVQNIENDPVKAQFVKSIVEIAQRTHSLVIAEGIETVSELLVIRRLGVDIGQGYLFARPHATPLTQLGSEVTELLRGFRGEAGQRNLNSLESRQLIQSIKPLNQHQSNEEALDWFEQLGCEAIPVVDDQQIPMGLITRVELTSNFTRPYRRELYGRKSCLHYADRYPLVVDKQASVQEISQLLGQVERRHFQQGFIVTDQGRYYGMAHGQDLMRIITEMQLQAAKYANPLTQLPGNVPIHEHLDGLLRNQVPFCACYFDLDNFKPYNDVYGFSAGDGIIRLTAEILRGAVDHDQDFLGHIGGDDFIVLFRSLDWEQRCQRVLQDFSVQILPSFDADALAAQGYFGENRRGEREFHELVSLSVGVVVVPPGLFTSYMEVSRLASGAKKQAKKISGNAIFINRRFGLEGVEAG